MRNNCKTLPETQLRMAFGKNRRRQELFSGNTLILWKKGPYSTALDSSNNNFFIGSSAIAVRDFFFSTFFQRSTRRDYDRVRGKPTVTDE